MDPDWSKMQGLLPVVIQDHASLEVLMLGYMDQAALDLTRRTGDMHFFSRSRNRLWRKGEESGNWQHLKALTLDCDGDALLAQVDQEGVICHTGKPTCFHHPLEGSPPALQQLWHTIQQRKAAGGEGSYTAKLLGDENLRLKKIAEEAGEVIMACKDGDKAQAVAEFADLTYHLYVAMAALGISPGDVAAELARRAAAPRP